MGSEIDEVRKQLMVCNNPLKQVALLNRIKQLEREAAAGTSSEKSNPIGRASA